MYKDSSCRSSPQPPPPTATAIDGTISTTTTTAITSIDVADTTNSLPLETPSSHSVNAATTPHVRSNTLENEVEDEDGFSCPSESSSDSDYEVRSSRPSTTSTTSTSSSSTAAAPAVGAPCLRRQKRTTVNANANAAAHRCHINSDVRLLRKIGYIASRVRFLAKIYGDFKLVNPYSPAKQKRLLQEILLKHSIVDPERELAKTAENLNTTVRSLTPNSSVASSYCCLPQNESSFEDDSVTGTVRRKSSTSVTASASNFLLEDLLIQLYEDRRNKVTIIRRRRSRRSSAGAAKLPRNHLIIMSSKTASSSVERLLQLDNEDEGGGGGGGIGGFGVTGSESSDRLTKGTHIFNANITASTTTTTSSQQRSSTAFLQPAIPGDENLLKRRRASDCTPSHPGQTLSNQLQITLKNNNCTKFPLHRGSCGAAGEHLLAANSIANRQTLILSKSCGNVDTGLGPTNTALYGSADLRNLTVTATTVTGSSITTTTGSANIAGGGGVGTGGGVGGNGLGSAQTNGNNEYSIVQLNNTIIQCHFNDEDFRALVKDLKRKVEYTERMNWLCLSKRPMGPPHRKSSLPKHQEVKKRFLEICDTTFSEEVLNALRLPAFDSYEWSDADIIHLMQTMFVELGFIEKFNLPIDTLREWLYEVYKHYNEVPFHNFRHCFCVAQMMYAITRQANLLQRLGDLECLILLVSCICHDLDHPGYNNIYQINARTELALRYNDISPLENHHCSIAFRLLEHPDCNIFRNFSREAFNQIREGIIRCILATDMARHNEILTQFKEITPVFDYSNRAHINLLCMILIKVADISNEARPMDVAEPWLDRLLQEFFAQSAAEKSEGLPVTPFMDPDKVSKPGSQVRFIGLVLLPLFEALGELVPELIDFIIVPVRIALDYYRRLNDAQNKSRKSVADNNSAITSENNSGGSDANAPSTSGSTSGGVGGGGSNTGTTGTGNSGGSISPQMPRSQSGISVKSRRSIPSQKSASRTSVDEPGGMPAELHDLPEGSESGDSETATEVDVAEKTSKFKVDTEGTSSRSKSSHSTSRKSSREKRPSMIGEMCSSGSGQRIRNSYGNIHGYHSNRSHFGSNRAVSLDQYSTNNRRLSDGLQQVISDSNVFYNRHNRGSLEVSTVNCRVVEDMNMNATGIVTVSQSSTLASGRVGIGATQLNTSQIVPNSEGATTSAITSLQTNAATSQAVAHQQHSSTITTTNTTAPHTQQNIMCITTFSNGNISPTQLQQPRQHCCAAAAAAAAVAAAASSNTGQNGVGSSGADNPAVSNAAAAKSSWKARLKQFSDYFSFSFDKNSKRFSSTRSSPCSMRNNNAGHGNIGDTGTTYIDPITGKPTSMCCTISNNLQSPGLRQKHISHQQELIAAGRHRAYSLDVPCNRSNPRYSSSSGGGGDSSRKSSRHDGTGTGDENNSNNTLHSSSGGGSDMPTCMPPPIRIGSVDASDTILIGSGSGLTGALTPANLGEAEPSLSIDLGLPSNSSSAEPSKI